MNYTWKFSWLLQKEHAVFENNFYSLVKLKIYHVIQQFYSWRYNQIYSYTCTFRDIEKKFKNK